MSTGICDLKMQFKKIKMSFYLSKRGPEPTLFLKMLPIVPRLIWFELLIVLRFFVSSCVFIKDSLFMLWEFLTWFFFNFIFFASLAFGSVQSLQHLHFLLTSCIYFYSFFDSYFSQLHIYFCPFDIMSSNPYFIYCILFWLFPERFLSSVFLFSKILRCTGIFCSTIFLYYMFSINLVFMKTISLSFFVTISSCYFLPPKYFVVVFFPVIQMLYLLLYAITVPNFWRIINQKSREQYSVINNEARNYLIQEVWCWVKRN